MSSTGEVTAVANGSTNITASVGGVTGTASVSVSIPDVYPVSLQITNVRVNGQPTSFSQGVTVSPLERFDLTSDYTIHNQSSCAGCISQIIVGVEAESAICAYSGSPGLRPGRSASASVTLTAPDFPGATNVFLRYKFTQQFTCSAGVQQYLDNPPPGSATIIGNLTIDSGFDAPLALSLGSTAGNTGSLRFNEPNPLYSFSAPVGKAMVGLESPPAC